MENSKLTKYSDVFHKLRRNFDVKETKMCHKETFPKETKDDVNLVTLDKESLHSPPVAEVITSREETLATLQCILDLLTHGVSCMIQEMHEGEEEDSSASTLVEEKPSFSPTVGDNIFPVGGTLLF